MGRKKIEIKKIEKKTALEVAFSKRRTGVFKKAGQLCVLSGATAAVVVFSPAGTPFVFGHPTADAVLRRFLDRDGDTTETDTADTDTNWDAREKALGQPGIEEEGREGGFSWDVPVENMGLNELEKMKRSIQELREKVADQVEEMAMVMVSMESKNGAANHPPSSTAVVVERAKTPPPPHEYSSPPVVDADGGLDAAGDQSYDNVPDQGFHTDPFSFSDDLIVPQYYYNCDFFDGEGTTSYPHRF